MLNRSSFTRYFVSTVLAAVVFCSCTGLVKPCQHEEIFEPCSDFQIEYARGLGSDFENVYAVQMKNGYAVVKKGVCCWTCGAVVGFDEETICGSFSVRQHTYCR